MQSPIQVLRVNGKSFSVAVDPATALLYVLRNDLGLKGTRAGCAEGSCFSCTVLIDGRPHQSCAVPVTAAEGKNVQTVESLEESEVGRSLVASFVREQAGQCGYCLAGILMSAKALLDSHAAPTRSDIIAAVDGHLCRCGAHTRILRAIENAALARRSA